MTSEEALLAHRLPGRDVDSTAVRSAFAASGSVAVVLDDDPTGTQSVADLPVLTSWSTADFAWAFDQGYPAVYVLTNTRSLDPTTTGVRNEEVARAALTAAAERRLRVTFFSRGDSTLRGHFPLETDVLAASLAGEGRPVDAVVVIPAFPDAGRVTVGGIHYMRQDGDLVPVAQTEFAHDATFGYRSSDLREWVEEKTEGRWAADDVVLIDLDTIRLGPEYVAALLSPLTGSHPVVADAHTEDDLRLLALGLIESQRTGKHLLFRVGPPFVRAYIGQDPHPPLTTAEVYGPDGSQSVGGLIVVGSHVALTTRQLERLTARRPLAAVLEIDADVILGSDATEHLAALRDAALDALTEGDVVVHTSRSLRRVESAAESLDMSRRISAAVVELVRTIVAQMPPRFVVAKGGITSSDVATEGLGIRRAIVRGPLLPGLVSLWQPTEGPALGVPYVVFAGNVGTDESLADVVETLRLPDPPTSQH